MTLTIRHGLSLLSAALACAPAIGADKEMLESKIDAAVVDMPVTTSPASFVLGTAGQAVPRLSTFRSFATQIARAYDANGKLANAIGAEIAPALAIGSTTWQDINTWYGRTLALSTISFATRAAKGSIPAQDAVGLQSILYAPVIDQVIGIAISDKCTVKTKDIDASLPATGPGLAATTPSKEARDKTAECQKLIDLTLNKWNQSVVAVGWGKRMAYDTDAGKHVPDLTAYWLSAAFGGDVGNKPATAQEHLGQLLTLHYRVTNHAETTDTGGADVLAKQRLAGINYRYGNRRLGFIGEYSRAKSTAPGATIANRTRKLLGLEYLLQEGLYLTVGAADDTGLPQSKRSLLMTLNWGISEKSAIFPK